MPDFSELPPEIQPFVYIAGAYGDSDGYLKIEERIQLARRAAADCALYEIPFYSPHLNCAHFEVVVPGVGLDFWIKQDSAFLPRAAAVLVIREGWMHSTGTLAEMKQARDLGLPIFFYPRGEDVTVMAFTNLLVWWGKNHGRGRTVSEQKLHDDETDESGKKKVL